MNFHKLVAVAVFLGILATGLFGGAQIAQAASIDELLARIAQLRAQIQELQKQLQTQSETTTDWCHTFNTNLRIGDVGEEVTALQLALQKEGLIDEEISSNEFEEKVASAVVGFQEKYKNDILAPYRLARGTGFVGVSTRAKLNKLYGCSTPTPIPVPTPTPTPGLVQITALSPSSGPIGTTVTMMGYGFTATENHILVGVGSAILASADSKDGKILTFTIPSVMWPNGGTGPSMPVGIGEMKLFVTNTNGTSSSSIFTVTEKTANQPSITVLSPNGGEKLIIGNTYRITWSSSGIDLIKIYIHNDSIIGSGSTNYITPDNISVSAAVGYYDWNISQQQLPIGQEGRYKIRIYAAPDTNITDASDAYFSIVSTPVATLKVVNNAALGPITVTGGQSSVLLGSYILQTDSVEGVSVSSINLGITGSGAVSAVSNLTLKRIDTGVQIGSAIATPAVTNIIRVSGQLNIPANATIGIYVYGDLSTMVSNVNTLTTNIQEAGVSGIGLISGKTINSGAAVTGRTITVIVAAPVAAKPSVDLKVNASDGPITILAGGNPAMLSWVAKEVSSCSASLGGSYDINGDGYVNINDITLYTSKNPGATTVSDSMLKNISGAVGSMGGSYDVNGDGLININDATFFKVYNPEATTISSPMLYGITKAQGALWGSYDINGDGVVNINDISLFVARNPGATASNNEFLQKLVSAFGATVENNWSGSKELSASQSAGALATGRTYALSCAGSQGTVMDSVGVIVK